MAWQATKSPSKPQTCSPRPPRVLAAVRSSTCAWHLLAKSKVQAKFARMAYYNSFDAGYHRTKKTRLSGYSGRLLIKPTALVSPVGRL